MAAFSPDPGLPGDRPDRGKPRIWAGGRQRPRFDLRAFLRVSATNSRAVAAPTLATLAGNLERLGVRVEDGEIRIPANRLGHTGRFLPSHVATGRRLRDSAALTRLAGEAARGSAPAEATPLRSRTQAPAATPSPVPVAGPAVTERAPVQRPKRPAPLPVAPVNAEGDRDTLEAIRTLMHTPVVEPVHPQRTPKAPPAMPGGVGALPELAPAEPTPRGTLFRLAGKAIGAVLVGLAFPIGMARAGFAIARGEDLRLVP